MSYERNQINLTLDAEQTEALTALRDKHSPGVPLTTYVKSIVLTMLRGVEAKPKARRKGGKSHG